MSVIRAILNNGLSIIVLIVAITLYLAYSDSIKRDHGITDHTNQPIASNQTHSDQALQNEADHSHKNNSAQENSHADTTATDAHLVATNEENTVLADNIAQQPTEATKIVIVTAQTEGSDLNNATNTSETEDSAKNQANENVTEVQAKPAIKAVINPETANTDVANFASIDEAMQAARDAEQKQDFATSSRIYLDIAANQPSANILGYLANSLHQDGKQQQAKQAWIDSAKLLVKENRLQDASMLASRLIPYAPEVAQNIHMNVQKIRYQQMMNQQQMGEPVRNKMPKKAQIKPFAPIKEMPQMPAMNQQPMINNQSMPAMQNYNPQTNPQYLAMQKQQQEQYQAYLNYMHQQEEMMKKRMPMAPPQQFMPSANAHYPNYPNGQ